MSRLSVFLLVIGAIVLIFLLIFGGWAFRYYTAEIRGIIGAEERLESAPSRIVNYNHYFDLCATVQSNEDAIQAQKERLETVNDEDVEDRIHTNIAALKSQRMRNIRDYNQDARKEDTQARFRSSDLPYQLNPNAENTRCTP